MQIENGICKLCGKEKRVFYDRGITDNIRTEFLSPVEVSSDLEQLRTCATCAYKIQLSCTIKKNHREPLRPESTPTQLCIFCGIQDGILLKTDDDPSDFKSQVNNFVKSSDEADYEKSLVCLRCLFGINVWTEMRSRIFAIMGISEQSEVENNNSIESTKEIAVVPPEVEETRSVLRSLRSRSLTIPASPRKIQGISEQSEVEGKNSIESTKEIAVVPPETLEETRSISRSLRSRSLTIPVSPHEIQNTAPKSTPRSKNLNSKRTLPLRGRFKKSISVKDLETVTFSDSIKGDQKMYLAVPYVNVQQTEVGYLQGIAPKRNWRGPPLKWSQIVSSPQDYNVNQHLCQICDKSFATKCEYLSHCLKHEKVEKLVINVERLSIGKDGTVQKLKKKPRLLPTETVNRLLTKYLGDAVLIDDTPPGSQDEGNHNDKKSGEPEEQQLKLKRKHFQFKINLNKNKKKSSVWEEDESSKDSFSYVQEEKDNEKTEETINEDTNQTVEESEADKVANNLSKDIETTPVKREHTRRKSSESDDITPAVSPLRITENSEAEDGGTKSMETLDKNIEKGLEKSLRVDSSTQQENIPPKRNEEMAEDIPVVVDTSTEVERKEETDLDSSRVEELVAAEEISSQPKSTEDVEMSSDEKEASIIEDEATDNAEVVTEENLDKEVSSSQDTEKVTQAEDIDEVSQGREIEEIPQTQEIEDVPQSQDIEDVPQSQEIEDVAQSQEIKDVPQSQEIEGVPQSQEIEDVPQSQEIEDAPQSEKNEEGGSQSQDAEKLSDIEGVPQSKENTEEIQEIKEMSQSGEIGEESQGQKSVEGSQSREYEEVSQSRGTEEVSGGRDTKGTEKETENDVIIVEELSVTEEIEKNPTLTKLKKRRMTTVLEITDTTNSDDDENVVEVLEDAEKDQIKTEPVSDKKKKCISTISLLNNEEIIIEEDVSETENKRSNEESDQKSCDETFEDNEKTVFKKTKDKDDTNSNNSSKDSTSSEDAVLKQMEMLGESVVWATQSDSESNHTEPDSSPTSNGDNIIDQDVPVQVASQNVPIMTNEDLLKILVDDSTDGNDAVGGKRKRTSTTDIETNACKKARNEEEEGTSSK